MLVKIGQSCRLTKVGQSVTDFGDALPYFANVGPISAGARKLPPKMLWRVFVEYVLSECARGIRPETHMASSSCLQ